MQHAFLCAYYSVIKIVTIIILFFQVIILELSETVYINILIHFMWPRSIHKLQIIYRFTHSLSFKLIRAQCWYYLGLVLYFHINNISQIYFPKSFFFFFWPKYQEEDIDFSSISKSRNKKLSQEKTDGQLKHEIEQIW